MQTLLTGCTLGGIILGGCGGESDSNSSAGDADRFRLENLSPPPGFELTEGLVVDPQSVPGSEGGYRVIYNSPDGNIQLAAYVFPNDDGASEYFDFVFRGPGAEQPPGATIGDEASSVFDENLPHVLLIGFRRQNVVAAMQLAVDVSRGGPQSLESEALALMRELDARVEEGLRN